MSLARGLACAALLLGACAGVPEPERPLAERVRVDGRYLEDGGSVVLGYAGTGVAFRAEDEVDVSWVADGERVRVEVQEDAGEWQLFDLPEGASTLSVNTDGTPSDIRILKAVEHWHGVLRIVEVEGEVRPLPAPRGPRILFIGDSITAGAGADLRDIDPDDPDSKAGDNARLSFPQYVAERMDADVHQVAFSGRGIIRDWRGRTHQADGETNATQFFERVLAETPGEWDHCRWVPDAVVVGLGTNDFNPGIPERDAFVDAMADFLSRVREVSAPEAPVLLMVSPMFGEGTDKRAAHIAYLEAVSERAGPGVDVVDAGYHPGHASTFNHPVASEHASMADVLARELGTLVANSMRTLPDSCRG